MALARAVAAVCDVEFLAVGLEDALAGEDDLDFVGSARTSRVVLELLRDTVAPVVVVAGAGRDGVMRELHAARGDLVVVVIGADDPESARDALGLGARVYLSEEVEIPAVADALRRAAARLGC